MNLRIPILTASLVLASCMLEASDGVFKTQRQLDFPGQDFVVGKVWFNVERSVDKEVYFKPLVQPTFGMQRLKGEDNLPLGPVQCTVVKRTAAITPQIVLDITLARCPAGREYAVHNIIFELANPPQVKPPARDEIPRP